MSMPISAQYDSLPERSGGLAAFFELPGVAVLAFLPPGVALPPALLRFGAMCATEREVDSLKLVD